MKQRIMMVVVSIAFFFSSQSFAEKHVSEIQEQLQLEVSQENPVVSEEKRVSVVKDFARSLKKIDDFGLGDAKFFVEDSPSKREEAAKQLQKIKQTLQQLVADYHKQVKPVLLNNVKFKRSDYGALQNQGELAQLFFASRKNHKTGKPITGIWDYKQDVSDSFFDETMVSAGLKTNFPELVDAPWIQEALKMESELNAFRLFLAKNYVMVAKPTSEKRVQPNTKSKVVKTGATPAVSKVVEPKVVSTLTEAKSTVPQPSQLALAKTAHIKKFSVNVSAEVLVYIEEEIASGPKKVTVAFLEHAPSSETRLAAVHRFANAIKKLDEGQAVEALKASLSQLVESYHETIKSILLNNVSLKRTDLGAQANRGELIALFQSHVRNHYTGKPVMGKLRYQKDVSGFFEDEKMQDVGVLVDYPELEQDEVIQEALTMEKELAVLLFKHREYKMGE